MVGLYGYEEKPNNMNFLPVIVLIKPKPRYHGECECKGAIVTNGPIKLPN